LQKHEPFSLNKLEWWSQKWEPTYELPETLFDDGASEMTVTKVPGLAGYFAFYIPPDKKAIVMRHAAEMQGPWSERVGGLSVSSRLTRFALLQRQSTSSIFN
jgi:hypothetical protein